MSQYFNQPVSGRIMYVENDLIIKSHLGKLYISNDGGNSWKTQFLIEYSVIDKIIAYCRLASRLLRKGIHHVDVLQSGVIGMIHNKNVATISQGTATVGATITGSRPLSLVNIYGEFIFGEYRSNPERSSIGIFGFNNLQKLYKKAELTGIRHIHGIYQDPYTGRIWITTGDNDDEAAIYSTNNQFQFFDKVLSGSQQTRAIKLLFTEDYIYFGSDAPHEVNFLYRMKRRSHQVERLAEVGSSVFHGTKIDNWLFFSTAIEPSRINKTKHAEVWASPNGQDWKCLFRFKKDLLPMKFFQYGQVFFPNGSGDSKNLWISPFGTQFDNLSFKINLKDIEHRFNNC